MAGDWLRIRNWERWQSYRKDRGQPPWIKIHRQLAQNIDWVSLTDAQRGQLVAMWMLAASRDGVIPASPDTIKKLCFMDSEPDLQVFIDKGFIEHDANVTPSRRQGDAPDKIRREEIREEEKREEETPLPPKGEGSAGKSKKGVSVFDLSFPKSLDLPECRKAIDEWIEYKRSRGQPYKKPAHLNKLLEQFSRDGPAALMDAVNHSIACNYQGVFRPGGNNGKSTGRHRNGPGQSFDPNYQGGGSF